MSRILVLGGTGMLGHRLAITLTKNKHTVAITTRNEILSNNLETIFNPEIKVYTNVSAQNYNSIERVFCLFRPEIVINCIGVIKQKEDGSNPAIAVNINALLPQRLSESSLNLGFRLILMSTDCVFFGDKGRYLEDDNPDARDLYGLTKLLGEQDQQQNVLTIRTSIVGRELQGKKSLLEWFLQKEKIEGYSNAIFSGLPTYTISKIICDLIIPKPEIFGLYHISSEPTSKFDLLNLINNHYGLSREITKSDKLIINRSLDSTKFNKKTGFISPKWNEIIDDLLIHDPIYLNK